MGKDQTRHGLTQEGLRLGIVRVEDGRYDDGDANHAKGHEKEQEAGLDDSRLDAFLVARETDGFGEKVSKRYEHEQRQVGEQEDEVPEAVQERRVEPLPVVAVRRENDDLVGHDGHGQQEDGAEARGQRERAQPDAHAVRDRVLVVEHVVVALFGLAQERDGAIGQSVEEAVDEDADEDLAYGVVELLFTGVRVARVGDGVGGGG